MVGFAGQLAIGWVAILTLGAYVASVLAAGNVIPQNSGPEAERSSSRLEPLENYPASMGLQLHAG
jgi:ABC-type branched-subunit amino acid transport system permease subunit